MNQKPRREQTDKLFIPHSACGFHYLSFGADAKGKRGVPAAAACRWRLAARANASERRVATIRTATWSQLNTRRSVDLIGVQPAA